MRPESWKATIKSGRENQSPSTKGVDKENSAGKSGPSSREGQCTTQMVGVQTVGRWKTNWMTKRRFRKKSQKVGREERSEINQSPVALDKRIRRDQKLVE